MLILYTIYWDIVISLTILFCLITSIDSLLWPFNSVIYAIKRKNGQSAWTRDYRLNIARTRWTCHPGFSFCHVSAEVFQVLQFLIMLLTFFYQILNTSFDSPAILVRANIKWAILWVSLIRLYNTPFHTSVFILFIYLFLIEHGW